MPRFKITVEYDGTATAGWQRQPDRPSIQGYLEAAAERLDGGPREVMGAGRTDAGVHARAQVAHLDMARDITAYKVMHGLNYHLKAITSQVVVTQAEAAANDFHARFDATQRRYLYRIVNRPARLAIDENRAWHIPEPLDADAMRKGASLLLGHHDFTTFRSSECQAKSALKTLERLDIITIGEEIRIEASARSFLHHQVRNMVGTLRLIGNGKWNFPALEEALEARDRRRAGETAPAQGLYLMGVQYSH